MQPYQYTKCISAVHALRRSDIAQCQVWLLWTMPIFLLYSEMINDHDIGAM